MPSDAEIEKDQYEQIHSLAAEVHELAGEVKASNDINKELIKLMRRESNGKFCIIALLIAALIYGALGENGFNAIMRKSPSSPAGDGSNRVSLVPLFSPPDNRMVLCNMKSIFSKPQVI